MTTWGKGPTTVVYPDPTAAAAGLVPSVAPEAVFGYNPAVGAALPNFQFLWALGGIYTGFLQTDNTLRVRAGGNAADDIAGAGARTILVEGINASGDIVSEILTTAGAAQGPTGVVPFIRVNKAQVLDLGTFLNFNVGTVTIETSGGAAMAVIPPTTGRAQNAMYSVPAGYTAFIRRLSITSDGNGINYQACQRAGIGESGPPYQSIIVVTKYSGVTSHTDIFDDAIEVPEMSEFWMDAARVAGGGTSAVGGNFTFFLRKNN